MSPRAEGYATAEEAVQAAMLHAAGDPKTLAEGFAIYQCVGPDRCVREAPTSKEMEKCRHCKVTVVPPGGSA